MFEISHRFLPSFSEGADALWGLDGPVFNRFGLSYAPGDRVMIGLLRSNLDDNLELNAKGQLFSGEASGFTYAVGVMGGVAINFGATESGGVEDNEAQYYVQALLNAAFGDRLALGLVPTGFRNPRIGDVDPVSTFALGIHGQYYTTSSLSFLVEWNLSEESVDYGHDAVAFGIDIETRGHFFKIVATNQVRMNPTQFLVGTPFGYAGDDWRLGFNITRLLSF
jgi:hypothetical protein